MISEYSFRRPTWDFVGHFSHHVKDKKLYYAQIDMISPLQGLSHDKAYHAVDITLGLQNFNKSKQLCGPLEQNKYIRLANSLADSWLRYAYAKEPWTPYRRASGRTVKIFDYSESEVDAWPYDAGRQKAKWDVMEEVGKLDETWRVLQGLSYRT